MTDDCTPRGAQTPTGRALLTRAFEICDHLTGRVDGLSVAFVLEHLEHVQRYALALSTTSNSTPEPELSTEQVQLLAWAVSNCHTLARRSLAKTALMIDREKWEHVLRICEKAGARSKGVLRAALPTEITEGSASPGPVAGAVPAPQWMAFDGSLTIRFLQYINAKRAERWHGLKSWSALEWAGAMSGEAGEASGQIIELLSTLARFTKHVGEAANAAKKLKRVEDGIANINLENGRSLTDVENASAKVVDEIADTVIYGVLLAERVGLDLEEAIRMKFNRKSEEYGFPERIPANGPPSPPRSEQDETQVKA